MVKYLFLLLFITSSFFYSFYLDDKSNENKNSLPSLEINYRYVFNPNLKETLYTFQNYFLEIDLETQTGYLHSRDNSIFEFGISSGTDKVEDGILTREGLFVIQSKMHEIHSRQFDSTLLLYWMGFNYGIGFHALATRGYYRHLGLRNVSHGCIRLAREDAKYLYERIYLGTPVLVHNLNNAVTIGFADSSEYYTKYDYFTTREKLKRNFSRLYKGRNFLNREKMFIDKSNIYHEGLPIGNSELIPKKQLVLK